MIAIIKNNKLYISNDKTLIKNLKNCYVIRNTGAAVNPCLSYFKKNGTKRTEEEIIGGIKELIEFLIENRENSTFIITGFSKATFGAIYRNYLEISMEQAKEKINNNKIKIKELTKK